MRIDEFVAQKEMALLLFGPVKVAVLPSCEWVWEKILVTFVARVSAQVVEKIGRRTGAKKRNRGAGEFPIFPFPSTLFHFFALLQLSRNNSIGDACQAG